MTTAIITDPQDFFSCIIQLEIQIQYIIQLETDSILGTKAGFFLFFSFCLDFLSLLYFKKYQESMIHRGHDERKKTRVIHTRGKTAVSDKGRNIMRQQWPGAEMTEGTDSVIYTP